MNDKIRQHVAAYCASKGYPTDDETIARIIQDRDTIWESRRDSRRWWDDVFCVVSINGLEIGFMGARTTGDDSPRDRGWEFDPRTICEVEKHTETVVKTTYRPKKEVANVG